jgi:hypothetical protein
MNVFPWRRCPPYASNCNRVHCHKTQNGEAEEISDEGKVEDNEDESSNTRFPKTLPNDPSVSVLIHTVFPLSSV